MVSMNNLFLIILIISLVGCGKDIPRNSGPTAEPVMSTKPKSSASSAAGDSEPHSGVSGSSTFSGGGAAKPAKVDISQMLEIKEKEGEEGRIGLEIKGEITTPIFVKSDKSYVVKDISEISFDEFQDTIAIVTPKTNFFVNHHLNNPFAEIKGISSVASIWGKKVSFENALHDAVIIRIGEEFKDYKISTLESDDFKKELQKKPLQTLGTGAKGSVSSFKYNNGNYALKEQNYDPKSFEYFDTSRLFFTDAVAGVFGHFRENEKDNMIIQLGQSFADAPALDEQAVLDAAKRFTGLAHAQTKLGINNKDIKMENMILVNGRPMVIDIDRGGRTPEYSGTAPQLLARVLLENHLEHRLRIVLDPYQGEVKRYLQGFRTEVDKEVWFYFLSYACTDLLKKTATDCYEILSDDDKKLPNLYKNIIKNEDLIKKFRTTFNRTYSSHNDPWALDVFAGFVYYGTDLPLPQSLKAENLLSEKYWTQKEKIINGYCSAKQSHSRLYQDLAIEYHCQKVSGDTWTMANAPMSTADKNYVQWLYDMFEPIFYARVFQMIHKMYWNNGIVPFILKEHVDDKKIATPILNLYNTAP